MYEKNQKMCGRCSHTTVTNVSWLFSRRFSPLYDRSRCLMVNPGLIALLEVGYLAQLSWHKHILSDVSLTCILKQTVDRTVPLRICSTTLAGIGQAL